MHNHNMTFIFQCITLGIMRETRHSADNTSVAYSALNIVYNCNKVM